jgi:signal peptidase II
MTESRGPRAPYVWILAAVVVLDQATKLIVDRMMALHESHDVIDGFLRLTYVRNRGAAFGLLSDADLPFQAALFSVLSLGALAAIGLYAWRLPVQSRLPRLALALIMGGAVGNLIDRMRLGYVIDFVDAYLGPHHWPAFNVADSAITVGVVLLVLDMLLHPHVPAGEGAERGQGERAAARVPAATSGGE